MTVVSEPSCGSRPAGTRRDPYDYLRPSLMTFNIDDPRWGQDGADPARPSGRCGCPTRRKSRFKLHAIRAFAGDDIEAAVLYPEDERYLIGDSAVTHHEVVDGAPMSDSRVD